MEERGRAPRRRVLKSAKIIFNNRSGVIDCTVRSLSNEGANLHLGSAVGVPKTFELLIEPDGMRFSCCVTSLTEETLDVHFLGPAK